jgi:hypothetical protein
VLSRIFNITSKTMGVNARPAYGTPFSILMFLPTGQKGQQIGRTCRAWGSLMIQSQYWRNNFIIIGLSEFPDKCKSLTVFKSCLDKDKETNQMRPYCSEEKLDGDDLKEKIINLERKALEEGKGLVILTGQRATMGISLPCVDMVFMLDEEVEADIIIQKMYRALTDSPGKRYGFIFDFNIRRIFKAKYEYANIKNMNKFTNRQPLSELLEQEFQTSLWDSDAWVTKTRTTETFNDFMQQIKDQLFSNLNEIAYGSIVKDIEKEDMKLLDTDSINPTIKAILKGSSIIPKPQMKTEFQKPANNAPLAALGPADTDNSEDSNNESGNNGSNNENNEPNGEEMNEKEKSKLIEIIPKLTKQFVNLLYLRSDSDSPNFDDLLKMYDDDKKRYDEGARNNSFNLYIQIVHDLLNFIPVPKMEKDAKTGLLYVGPSSGGKKEVAERQSDWNKIKPGTKFKIILKDRVEESIYHPFAKTTTNKWAIGFFEGKPRNVFEIVFVETGEGDIKLNDYVKSLPDENSVTTDIMIHEKVKRCKLLLDFVRLRFKNKDEQLKLIYTNYLEAFMQSVKKEAKRESEADSRYNKIFQVIEKHLVPDVVAKGQRGEVFTPPMLIREMLFGIRKSKNLEGVHEIWGMNKDSSEFEKDSEEDKLGGLPESVWKNSKLKWLDPASGIGNFPITAFYKLDHALSNEFKDVNERRKHIIQEMLYMIELDKGNASTCKKLFKMIHPEAVPNIINKDTLSFKSPEQLRELFGFDKFDIIMGNPPFNAGGTLKGGGALWPDFVKFAFNNINKDGYIVYVHPPGWRKFYDPEMRDNQGKLLYEIKENEWNIDFINVSDIPPPHFPPVDHYIIHTSNKEGEHTEYNSTFAGEKDIGMMKIDYPFIPNLINKATLNILKKIFSMHGDVIKIVYNQNFKPTSKDTATKGGVRHYHFTDKDGRKHYYNKVYESNTPSYISKPKVIMTFNGGYEKGKLFAFYSDESVGTTNNSMYMEVDNKRQADHLVEFFNSDIITFLMKITQYSASPNHKNEFKILNMLKVPKHMDDYNLTKEEKELINKIIAKTSVSKDGKTRRKGKKQAGAGYFNKTRRHNRLITH